MCHAVGKIYNLPKLAAGGAEMPEAAVAIDWLQDQYVESCEHSNYRVTIPGISQSIRYLGEYAFGKVSNSLFEPAFNRIFSTMPFSSISDWQGIAQEAWNNWLIQEILAFNKQMLSCSKDVANPGACTSTYQPMIRDLTSQIVR